MQAPVIEVVHGVVDGIERVALGAKRHSPLRREGHELDEIVVGANKVADEVDLGRDDVDGWHLQHPSVADELIRPGPTEHRYAIFLGPALADEVEHGFAAGAFGKIANPCHLGAVGKDGEISAALAGELQAASSHEWIDSTKSTKLANRAIEREERDKDPH